MVIQALDWPNYLMHSEFAVVESSDEKSEIFVMGGKCEIIV